MLRQPIDQSPWWGMADASAAWRFAGFDRAPGARPFLAHARLVGREPHAPRRRARVRQRSSKGFAGGRKTLTLTRTPKRISVRAVTRNEVTPDAGRLPGD